MTRILLWLTAALVVTVLAVTALVLARQLDRSQADDAPWRLATQVAAEIAGGTSTTVDGSAHVDLSRSLATWVVVENAQGQATSGTGYLKNRLVSLPSATLAAAAKDGRAALTWQPAGAGRFATVTVAVGDRFVSAGQSLEPSDARILSLLAVTTIGWAASLVLLALGYLFSTRRALRTLRADSPV